MILVRNFALTECECSRTGAEHDEHSGDWSRVGKRESSGRQSKNTEVSQDDRNRL